jgi:1,4-dihydroxy-2-naphthoate octaprenyltransferase
MNAQARVAAPAAPSPWIGTWVMAIRPKTLTASAVPVLVGTAIAFGLHLGRVLPALAALLGGLLIQIGANLTNDYYDFRKGADTAERVGPTRVTQSGLIAPATVLRAAIGTFALSMVFGVYLVVIGGWPIVAIGLTSILAGYAYTGGPYPLGYHGLGDVFVFVFFGLLGVGGTVWVQALSLPPAVWPVAIGVGAIGTAILVVNNLRDIHTDAKAGKRTLAVRFGPTAARVEYVLMLAIGYAVPVLMFARHQANAWVLLPLASLPVTVPPLKLMLRESGKALNPALGGTARIQMIFGLLFAIGLLVGLR